MPGWLVATLRQCARVSSTEARLWVRLVGRRHDIQYWQPDSRGLDTLSCTRALRSLRSTEDWVKTILEFVQHRCAPPAVQTHVFV